MPTDLYFPLPDVLRLADHALAAVDHIPSFTEHRDTLACPGGLAWVADDGTYLMSTGSPPLLSEPTNPESNIVVYAHGWGPGTSRRARAACDLGGDDFVEHLHLSDADALWLRDALTDGYPWLVLRVTPGRLEPSVSRRTPT